MNSKVDGKLSPKETTTSKNVSSSSKGGKENKSDTVYLVHQLEACRILFDCKGGDRTARTGFCERVGRSNNKLWNDTMNLDLALIALHEQKRWDYLEL